MPSFRARVLDALDIKKKTVKLQVNERFPKTHSTDSAAVPESTPENPTVHPGDAIQFANAPYTTNDHVDYAVSHRLLTTDIGPSFIANTPTRQTLDVLGFVVGEKMDGNSSGYLNSYPVCMDRTADQAAIDAEGSTAGANRYKGFHYLNGIYDDKSEALKEIRKSATTHPSYDTLVGVEGGSAITEHAHTDWPDNVQDQFHLLNENPYADALYYSNMRMSILLTGIQMPAQTEKASNHRGLVRMLVIKPKMPSVRVRFDGTTNEPIINMPYPPHWDTELFYSGKKTLGGRLNKNILSHTDSDVTYEHAADSHLSPTFGLVNHAATDPVVQVLGGSIHYGHPQQNYGESHHLTPFDMMTSPINRKRYTVLEDKTFTLDTQHHGVAAQRLENVDIRIGGKIKFAGRKPFYEGDVTQLGDETFNEPLNMHSRPIVMFLSMDQKISAQVTGYTTITEC